MRWLAYGISPGRSLAAAKSDESDESDFSDLSDLSDIFLLVACGAHWQFLLMKEDSVFLPHGGYESLRAYQVAEAVYDATVVFCDRFIPRSSRTHDQMVQAARSGVRNISEGSGAAATSRKSEMKLTNVARASLNDELLKDYKSFLTQRGLRVWHKDSRQALAMRDRLKHDVVPGFRRRATGW